MTALVSGEDTPLANKCFDFCKALASQGMTFSFSLTLGSNFSVSLQTREMAPHSVCKDKAWKKKSPSTIRRNARRREAFLQKKQSPAADPARPLNILPSPTDSSGRRQVVSLGRDPTAPSFTQLDGAATASPPPGSPPSQPRPSSPFDPTTGTAECDNCGMIHWSSDYKANKCKLKCGHHHCHKQLPGEGVVWSFESKGCKEEGRASCCKCCHCMIIPCRTLNPHLNV